MFRTLAALALITAGVTIGGCSSTTAAPRDAHATDWEMFKASMVGTFSSREQSKADPRNYQDVRLVMTNIWPGRTDGYWLYVEQALASDTWRPYRQRVYRLVPDSDGTFRTTVFTLPGNPLRFSDGTGAPRGIETISVNQLAQRDGCDIVFRAQSDGTFTGATVGKDCPTDVKGAKYATSVVKVTRRAVVSWDRWFDAKGKQVLGATKGGYVFKRDREVAAAPSR